MQTLYHSPDDTQIVLLTSSEEVEEFIALLERIAAELLWQPGDQIQAGAEMALHIAGKVKDEMAGGLQLRVENEYASLPCKNVWPEVGIGTGDNGARPAAHVTILALKREYRGHIGLFWPLCVELWRWCKAGGIHTIFLEATPATLRVYQRLGWPLEVVGDLRMHWGEDCYLCRATVSQMEAAIAKRACRSAKYRAFLEQAYRGVEYVTELNMLLN